MSSTDDECKLPPHSREANKYPKHKTHNKNRTNDTDTGEIYNTASLLNIVLCNPRESHSVCKPVGIRINFIRTLNKKEIALSHADGNGLCTWKGTAKNIFKVTFDETKIKVISARICKVDASGSLYVNERKINIESDDVFQFFREYRESKANPNFNFDNI